jgi:hypothetical protein
MPITPSVHALLRPKPSVVSSILHCKRSVSRVWRRLRFVSPAGLSSHGRHSCCSQCSWTISMRYIFQLMVAPLMFLVNWQCRMSTPFHPPDSRDRLRAWSSAHAVCGPARGRTTRCRYRGREREPRKECRCRARLWSRYQGAFGDGVCRCPGTRLLVRRM